MNEGTIEETAGRAEAAPSDCLGIYFSEIRRIPVIDRAEEARLAREIRSGDRKSLAKLVRANLRFVVSVSKRYRNQGVAFPDLINEGNLGLIQAARTFDERRGASFATHARWWIRRHIRRVLAEQGRVVRVPRKQATAIRRVTRRRYELLADLGREPTARELAEDMGLTMREVERTIKAGASSQSLDEPMFPGEGGSLTECLPVRGTEGAEPGREAFARARAARVAAAVRSLDKREAQVLRRYFGLDGDGPASLDDVGAELGISGERVRQIKEKALMRLRSAASVWQLEAVH